ncbi:hypothetical protein EDC96DRAFT_605840 [Choanephora cucurbitarum]|nr:hypothetical protein EDC96DRAFT_605840 [Choanephora cucurbitarum]
MTRREKHHQIIHLKFFKSIKSLLSIRQSRKKNSRQQFSTYSPEPYAKEGVAVTLTTEFTVHKSNMPVTLVQQQQQQLTIVPCKPTTMTTAIPQTAYVHYEPKKLQVAIGINVDGMTKRRHHESLRLTVQQYAWLVQQLREEQEVHRWMDDHLATQGRSISLETCVLSPMLGVLEEFEEEMNAMASKTIRDRFISFVQQRGHSAKWMVAQPRPGNRQCIFMLPKALVLQASAYIPMTKPLPSSPAFETHSMHASVQTLQLFEPISDEFLLRLKRYCRFVQLCSHELLVRPRRSREEPSPSPSFVHNNKQVESLSIGCGDCSISTGLETVLHQTHKEPTASEALSSEVLASSITARLFSSLSNAEHPENAQQQSIMFPISYIPYGPLKHALKVAQNRNQHDSLLSQPFLSSPQIPKEKQFVSSAIQPSSSSRQKRVLFDSITRKQKPHAFSAFQYIPPDQTFSSEISSISEFSGIQDHFQEEEEEISEDDSVPQKYGYVAVDNEHEEIVVVFSGMAVSPHMLHNASFAPVPWLEIETITTEPLEEPWVLECALTAWRRCEMKVVTLLMRLCSTMPAHYKVTIIGHSLGGAVAALCASSLRSTRLLTNRLISVYAIHSPRVGNRSFLNTLVHQKVETIRITHPTDIIAHLPPRTSGLVHLGTDATVVLANPSKEEEEEGNGLVLSNMSLEHIEDTLSRAFPMTEFDTHSNSVAWDITLDDNEPHF